MRRNEKVLNMPANAHLVAATYGVGRDDYLCVVLAYIPHDPKLESDMSDQFVTWNVNTEVDPIGFGEGHYMPREQAKPGTTAEYEWIVKAWDDFERRSRKLYQRTAEWFKWESDQKAVG